MQLQPHASYIGVLFCRLSERTTATNHTKIGNDPHSYHGPIRACRFTELTVNNCKFCVDPEADSFVL